MSAAEITAALGGHWHGSYGTARCPAHDDHHPSLSLLDVDGGVWVECHAGCDWRDVRDALCRLGLVEGRPPGRGDWREPDPAETARRRAAEAAEAERRRQQAARCWRETVPIADTLGERYLRARDIRCALPASLRFHGDCWHKSGHRFPALVAAVQRADGRGLGIQRTYLAEPARKAVVEPPKASLGPVGGGAVRLCHGPGALVVCEGVEDGLSLVDALAADRGVSVWATLGTSGMAGLELPNPPKDLVVAPDGDAAGRKAAEALARRAVTAGWRVRMMAAPGEGRDWNDAAREVAA